MGGKLLIVEEKALGVADNIISGFFGEEEWDDSNNSSFGWDLTSDDYDESDSTESSLASPQRTEYWESQHLLLQEILEHHNSTCSKFRREIGRVIEMGGERIFCECSNLNSDACAKCLRQRVVNLLCHKGFNATLFTSKWKHTHKFPAGTHEYIQVIASTQGRRKQIPILIELEFKDEFKMLKACDEYNELIQQLPEVYIGKPDHLNAIIRVACDAAKRSATEKKIHMGPWRKRSFMLMKWSDSQEIRRSIDQSSTKISFIPSRTEVLMPSVNSCLQFSASTAVKVT